MPGIAFLYEEYKKDPKRIEKMLSEKLEISEKLDGSRFQVQVDESGKIHFFKRKDVSISKIDRTLAKYYEKAISHFENFSKEKISGLPEGWRFGMEYFPNLQPVTISYDRLPLNNLVLTDIQVRDPKDKILEIITDKETLNKWAETLEVEKPPIIFEGNLSDAQKRRILDFLNTPYSELVKRFKTENFTTFILNLLNPELKTAFLHNSLDKDIDGLIFRFDGKEPYRVSNPEIVLKKSEKRDEKPSDIYNLTLVLLHEFVTSLDFKKIKLKEKNFEDRYIEFICKVFNLFCLTPVYKENFKDEVDFELPRYLTREESSLNFKFVKDPETLRLLNLSTTNRELFKILLASMRSHKKKATGFFTKELVTHHNQLVDKIADYVNSDIKENVFYTFGEFRSVFLTENSSWQEDFGKEMLDETEEISLIEEAETPIEIVSPSELVVTNFPSYEEFKDEEETSQKSLSLLKKLVSEDEELEEKKKTSVCLMAGKFFPFHNGHATSIQDAFNESGKKVFLAVTRKRLPKMESSLHEEMIKEACGALSCVHGYIFTEGRSLKEIVKDLPSNLKVECFAGSMEECEDVAIQFKNVKTFPMSRHMRSSSVLKKLADDDVNGYKKLMPKFLHNFYYKLKNENPLNESSDV